MKVSFRHEIKKGSVSGKEMVEMLLKNRKIKNIEDFLHPQDPQKFSLKDFGFSQKIVDKVIKILRKIKENGESIVVYTDYDADGITGGAILWETLHLLGFKAMPYVPHRKLEGYGFSKLGIDNVKKQYSPSLIISVDHGITAVDQVKYAKKLGIQVVVTDHHSKQKKIPRADAIFHIPALSGSGVAYFFAKELFTAFKKDLKQSETLLRLEHNFRNDYLALASIGSVADLVPLIGATRSLVTYGLKAFPFVKRYGIKHICQEAGIAGKVITPYEIGFIIAPRINAVGRLEHAIDALRLLCTTNSARALELAGKVGRKNTERQDMVKQNVEEAMAQLVKIIKKGELAKIIILHSKNWHEGVIGLIASNIAEKYYRPTIVMSESDGQLKGSARSIPSFHITKHFEKLKKYFVNFGGHAGAAGFTLEKKNLESFTKASVKLAEKQIKDSDLERVMEADMKVSVSLLNMPIAKAIETLRPFGIGNPQPSFVSDIEIISAQLFGKTSDHLKVLVRDAAGSGFPLEMIAFKKADLFSKLSRNMKLQIVYQLDINVWNGRETMRGKIQGFIFDENKVE